MYKEGVALKRKIVFPLFRTIKVCGEKEGGGGRETKKDNKAKDFQNTFRTWTANVCIIFF